MARVYGPAEAEIIRSLLECEGIRALVRGRVAQFVYPLTVDGLAEMKVLVPAADAEAARALIASAKAAGEEGGGEPEGGPPAET